MDHQLRTLIAERIAAGLQRKSVTTCSRWAEKYRVMNTGPWRFRRHPWLRDMHDSTAELNVGQKAAQMGYTETVLNKTFYNMDVRGIDCLYVLPSTSPDASDFSSGRFDPALELSAHLHNFFSDVKNVGHKRAGKTNLYVRGSRSRSQLKSIPTGFIVLDEVDEMDQNNIPLAMERAAGQAEYEIWMISTATIENTGINGYYNDTSQNHFMFVCPSCSRHTELIFPESIVITATELNDPRLKESHLICKECKARLPEESKIDWLNTGKWIETFAGRDSKGWHINQLYSLAAAARPEKIAELFLKSQSDKAAEQEFWNSKLGLPHVVDGAQVTDQQIDDCKGDYTRQPAAHGSKIVTMGVDVGSWLHYEIDEWLLPQYGSGADINIFSHCRIVTYGKVRSFDELDTLFFQYGVTYAVIDAQPERRKSIEFANRFHGRVSVCWYPNGINGKALHVNETEQSVSVDRTSWLDLSLGRFKRGKPWLTLPKDIDLEYRAQIKAQVRVYNVDKNGNPIGQYVKKAKDADHYGHARNYAEIALPLAASLGSHSDIIQSMV